METPKIQTNLPNFDGYVTEFGVDTNKTIAINCLAFRVHIMALGKKFDAVRMRCHDDGDYYLDTSVRNRLCYRSTAMSVTGLSQNSYETSRPVNPSTQYH